MVSTLNRLSRRSNAGAETVTPSGCLLLQPQALMKGLR